MPSTEPRPAAGDAAAEPAPPAGPRLVGGRHLRAAGRALASLALGSVAIVAPILLVRLALLPLVEAAFDPEPATLSAIRRAGILGAALAGYLAYVRGYERRAASELRWRPGALLLAGVGGALLVAVPIAILFGVGAYRGVAWRGVSAELGGVAVLIVIAATLEELFYRCLLLRVLERAAGSAFGLAAQAVVFALPHLENLERAGARERAVLLVSVTLLGLLWGAVFLRTRNLWATVANHAAWNFTILLSGVPLSGIEDWRDLAPIEARLAGPDWLTGGRFGPESSALVLACVTVALVLLLRTVRDEARAPDPR